MMAEERLQKIIARTGLCSRRAADQMIADGRVTVDGRVAVPGEKTDPAKFVVKVDGKRLKSQQSPRYLLLYKPREVMTSCDDPEQRKTVIDLVRSVVRERVFPVGRLDYHSEGLIVLTNDGELAARISHPRHGVVREYMVKIRGDLTDLELRKVQAGASIEGRHVKPASVRRETKGRGGTTTWWRVEVTEGRTHEVRELFFRAGHHVQRLRRTAIGPLRDNTLKPGEFRTITESELAILRGTRVRARRAATAQPGRGADRSRVKGEIPSRAGVNRKR
jgi:23S rRNA pseudouridine2605 synthase